MSLANKLKKAREKLMLSQEQFAELIQVSRSAVAKWETGSGYPDISNLKTIAEKINISIDYLVLDNERVSPVCNKNNLKVNLIDADEESIIKLQKNIERLSWGLIDTIIFLSYFDAEVDGKALVNTMFSKFVFFEKTNDTRVYSRLYEEHFNDLVSGNNIYFGHCFDLNNDNVSLYPYAEDILRKWYREYIVSHNLDDYSRFCHKINLTPTRKQILMLFFKCQNNSIASMNKMENEINAVFKKTSVKKAKDTLISMSTDMDKVAHCFDILGDEISLNDRLKDIILKWYNNAQTTDN